MKLPEKPPFRWDEILVKEPEHVFELTGDKRRLEKLRGYNERYYHWNDLIYRIRDGKERKYAWVLMKFIRSGRYDAVPFEPIDLTYSSLPTMNKKLHQFDKFLAGNITLQSRALGLETRYIISSLMEEAIASSILEGAVTTRKVAKEMLRQKRKPKNRAERMVVNGYETMQMILKRQREELTPEFLLDIQTTITKGTLEEEGDVGRFRDNDDVTLVDRNGVSHHKPPGYKKVKKMVEKLCDFANDDSEFIHPIIKASILHFLIGYIHPFNDGNGRTARSVFYWYVLSRGYWLFEYMALSRRILRSRKDYSFAYLYSEYDDMDLTYFIRYVVDCVDDSLTDLLEYIKRKQIEQKEAKLILEKLKDLNFRQASILEEMMKNSDKYYSIQEIAEIYHVVYQTARNDLLNLTEKGYLTMKKIARKYIFTCDENCKTKLQPIIK